MGNVYDYLQWRGDLTIAERPFNEVDNLLLSLLSYIDLNGIVPGPGEGSVRLGDAAALYFAQHGEAVETRGEDADTAVEWVWMFHLMSRAPRFSGMKLSCFTDVLDAGADKQFSALSIETRPGQLYLAYRGTSDDIAGWKEDFLLACLPQIPSHEEALRYLTRVAGLYPDCGLTLGGHSKGGNLAVYAAVMADENIKARIRAVWSNDGPGFQAAFAEQAFNTSVAERIRVIVPRSSMIGLLLNQRKPSLIVESAQTGMLQHDGISWQVLGDHFVCLPALSEASLQAQKQISAWIDAMALPERRAFVDALFQTLTASGEDTVSGIMRDMPRALGASGLAIRNMDKATKDRVMDFIHLLITVWSEMEGESRREYAKKALGTVTQRFKKLQAAIAELYNGGEKDARLNA